LKYHAEVFRLPLLPSWTRRAYLFSAKMGNTEKKQLPTWQHEATTNTSTPSAKQTPKETPDNSRAALIDKASHFLDDDSIREASTERKTSFLESKGLSSTEIRDLLMQSMEYSPEEQETHPGQQPPPELPKDQPPIITYPEFLLHTQKPTPLITARRLLTGLYLVSGAVVAVYGISKYVGEPMIESLVSARHSLFESATTNLNTLNEKLEGAVSKIPDKYNHSIDEAEDTESIASDPARFFSRTAATQTTPQLSHSPSLSSVSESPKSDPTALQSSHLSNLYTSLAALQHSEDTEEDPLKEILRELQEYLDILPMSGGLLTGKSGDGANTDGISKVKAEIRSVKGALLSARNFPPSVVGR